MEMSVHTLAMETYVPALRTLSELLDKGVEHSKAKGTDADALLKERLAPDMFPLALQVQLACHRFRTLSATSAKAFDGAEDRRIELQLQGSRVLEADGSQFLWRWSIPLSISMSLPAYNILRHTGVQLGKRD